MPHDEDEDAYDNRHRAFLQAFVARSILTFEEARPILAAILSAHGRREYRAEDVTELDFRAYMAAANQAISPFDLEIRTTLHQKTRERIYALVNNTSDPLTQLATTYSADEISFLKRVLDCMFETNNKPRREVMAVKGMQAIHLSKVRGAGRRRTGDGTETNGEAETQAETQGSSGQDMTQAQAEKTLGALVEQGWLEKSKKGYYSLAPRALMELRGWLTETYNDEDESEASDGGDGRFPRIKLCYACKEIVTRGQRCADWRCLCRIHDICANGLFTGREMVCPTCKKAWDGEHYVGERADR